MSFDVDVEGRRGAATVAARFTTAAGLTVLLGPSGVGKTSVLHMIAGLVRPERGHVRVGGATLFDKAAGVDLRPERRCTGYVFQEPRLFPHLSVRANLLYGATGAGRLAETAGLLGIGGLLDRWPRTLSGGEARRVAIGRALLSEPAFLLLDEPLSSLDPARKEDATRLLELVRDEVGLPILMVTHDEREAARLGDAVVEMRGDAWEPAAPSHVRASPSLRRSVAVTTTTADQSNTTNTQGATANARDTAGQYVEKARAFAKAKPAATAALAGVLGLALLNTLRGKR